VVSGSQTDTYKNSAFNGIGLSATLEPGESSFEFRLLDATGVLVGQSSGTKNSNSSKSGGSHLAGVTRPLSEPGSTEINVSEDNDDARP
jgi:hypothetical protein